MHSYTLDFKCSLLNSVKSTAIISKPWQPIKQENVKNTSNSTSIYIYINIYNIKQYLEIWDLQLSVSHDVGPSLKCLKEITYRWMIRICKMSGGISGVCAVQPRTPQLSFKDSRLASHSGSKRTKVFLVIWSAMWRSRQILQIGHPPDLSPIRTVLNVLSRARRLPAALQRSLHANMM